MSTAALLAASAPAGAPLLVSVPDTTADWPWPAPGARARVALGCDWVPPRMGGLEIHLRDLARELTVRGHHVEVICTIPGPPELSDLPGVPVHRLPVKMMPKFETIRDLRCLPMLEQIFRERRFDIIHCHTVISPLAHAGATVARRLRLPNLITEHSVLRYWPVGIFRLGQELYPWADEFDVITAVSTFVAEEMRWATGRDDVQVLYAGINPDEWVRRPAIPDEPMVFSAMRFTKRKRPDRMVGILPAVQRQLAAAGLPPVKFVMYGEGPERLRAQALARRLGVADHVEMPGFRSRADVRAALLRSSVFLQASDWESCGVAALQARACGVPVVSMDNGGFRDTVPHDRAGLIASTDAELADHVARLIIDHGLQERLSQGALDGLERFCWDRLIEDHLAVYRLATERARWRR
jgi:glycosyltransferase involved in cell wall biosynthesis